MKKKTLLLVSLLLILLFYGCKEDVVGPVDPVASKCTIQVNQSGPGGVMPSGAITALKGETLALAVTKDVGVVSKATLNDGTEIPLKDGKYYIPVTSSATVNVEFEKTPKWQLAQYPWDLVSKEYRIKKTGQYEYTAYTKSYPPVDTAGYIPSKEPLSDLKIIFDEDSVKGYDITGKLVSSMKYSIDKDSIRIGSGITGKVIKLKEDALIYSAVSYYYEIFPKVTRVPDKDRIVTEKYVRSKR